MPNFDPKWSFLNFFYEIFVLKLYDPLSQTAPNELHSYKNVFSRLNMRTILLLELKSKNRTYLIAQICLSIKKKTIVLDF